MLVNFIWRDGGTATDEEEEQPLSPYIRNILALSAFHAILFLVEFLSWLLFLALMTTASAL